MGIANKLNSGRKQTVREGIDTKDLRYLSAAEYAKTNPDYPVSLAGFFIKNGEYGEQVTLIIMDGETPTGLNIPKRYVDMFKDLEPDEIDEIINGHLAISAITPDVKTPKGKTTYIEFEDV
jgi:hypothetical protein